MTSKKNQTILYLNVKDQLLLAIGENKLRVEYVNAICRPREK